MTEVKMSGCLMSALLTECGDSDQPIYGILFGDTVSSTHVEISDDGDDNIFTSKKTICMSATPSMQFHHLL